MSDIRFEGIEDALQQTLADIKEEGIITSPRGRESKEIIGYNFIIEDPRWRITTFKGRNLNPFYLVGNLLWVLSQSNKLDFIKYYNPKGIMFSDDGEILRGAYGKRIFDFDGVNQWEQCVKELKTDPDSRRAIITFHLPQHDWSGSLDTPCTASIQFFIRNGYLDMVNHMRSQSAAFVMPYDIFLMTMLQELMARELNVELGEYHHYAGSMHYYIAEERMVDMIIESDDYGIPMLIMPKDTTLNKIKPLLHFEKELREYVLNSDRINSEVWVERLKALNLDKYWNDFGFILIAKALSHLPEVFSDKNAKTFKDYYLQNNMFYKLFNV